MIYYIVEEQLFDKNSGKHAGGKAREDLSTIFSQEGFSEMMVRCPQIERESANILKKVLYHHRIAKIWRKALNDLNEGDILIIQFPVVNHTILLNDEIKRLKKRGIRIVAFIHDLDILRRVDDDSVGLAARWRMKKEEEDELREFDYIVAHNERMKEIISDRFEIDCEKIKVLELFDYLIPKEVRAKQGNIKGRSCIIAGNLAPHKSGYVYKLPDEPDFELFGVSYDEMIDHKDNVHYHGAYPADELPSYLTGGFGLVWDGDSADTCSGAWGEYLRYNNPHKTSLYLACGIPIIAWKEAAMADVIKEKNVGFTVESLSEINEILDDISDDEYECISNNAKGVSDSIRDGEHTKRVLRELNLNL